MSTEPTHFLTLMNNGKAFSSLNGGIVELLIPTFFQKKSSLEGTKTFLGKKKYGEIVLNWKTTDQIMPRFERSFINDKCIFQ